ncbi:MAG TPA: cation-translocating P-type ATPase [Anaeromyxobacteraceae bacterium]|nr:cation-translocating P-type ATPase [Anaeromyxobacteraceae bacterium]
MPEGADGVPGLTAAEAAARLAAEGPNELARDRRPGFLASVGHVLREPMLVLLLAAAGIYLVLGDIREALALLLGVLVVITITLVQERKTERALAALRDMASPRALVVRDGTRRRIPGREVVRGDVLVLSEGDRVPADAALLEASHLEADESLLTGESVPVRKRASAGAEPEARPGGDDLPFVYAGTLVVRGRGLAEVRATGARSEMGRIGTSLAAIESGRTPLQEEVRRIVKVAAAAGLLLCAALVALYGLTRGNWPQAFLAGIALAISMLPEEFPVVLTIFMALGAWRISRSRVLTRRLPAVEALGAATVLCTDKTGTLTENRMRVDHLWVPGALHVVRDGTLPEAVHALVEFGILASQRDPFDPMEQAFHRLGKEALAGTEHLHETWQLVREYPLSPELLAVSHVWREPGSGRLVVAAKGAPEAIADVCHLPAAGAAEVGAHVAEMAADGLRVLAVARAFFGPGDLPPGQHDFDFELVGLVGLEDPLRAGVPEAVAECASAGVRVVMITGDAPDTARAIARQAGLPAAEVISGRELESLSDEELRGRLERGRVFARTVPEQKLRIVQALRAGGEVVAMTGDGVNDAPALKAAHIGVAMGGRGTDVAREAAALVVTDDDFTSIVAAVRLGRRIHDNLRRAMAYVLAVHVPIAGAALVPVLLGWPLVLFPVHIVFLELVIDPACSVAFEAEPGDPGLMRRPPRRVGASLFGRRLVVVSLLQGAALLAATLVSFRLGLAHTGSEASGRAMAFATLIAGNVALILVNRSWTRTFLGTLGTRNLASWAVAGGATLTLVAALTVPFLRHLFRFGPASGDDILVAAFVGFGSLLWFEVLKRLAPGWLADR